MRRRQQNLEINRQAWEDVFPTVRELFLQRQRELLAEAGIDPDEPEPPKINWPARHRSGERNRAFKEFILVLLRDHTLDDAGDETMDLVEAFLEKPTGNNRVVLYSALKRVPLGNHTNDLAKFG